MNASVQPHIHPPKVELFNLADMTNTDPKGRVRIAEEYRVESAGLYLFRPAPNHPDFSHLESWLLPSHGIRATRFHWLPECQNTCDVYIDIVTIQPNEQQWRTTDLYLDIKVWTNQHATVFDTDEFLDALSRGYLDSATAEQALTTTYRAVDRLARHDYNLQQWLAEDGIVINWRNRQTATQPILDSR